MCWYCKSYEKVGGAEKVSVHKMMVAEKQASLPHQKVLSLFLDYMCCAEFIPRRIA